MGVGEIKPQLPFLSTPPHSCHWVLPISPVFLMTSRQTPNLPGTTANRFKNPRKAFHWAHTMHDKGG